MLDFWPRDKVWRKDWHRELAALEACYDAVKWAEQFDTLQEAWDACPNGAWLFWLLTKTKDARRLGFGWENEVQAETDLVEQSVNREDIHDEIARKILSLADQIRQAVPKPINPFERRGA